MPRRIFHKRVGAQNSHTSVYCEVCVIGSNIGIVKLKICNFFIFWKNFWVFVQQFGNDIVKVLQVRPVEVTVGYLFRLVRFKLLVNRKLNLETLANIDKVLLILLKVIDVQLFVDVGRPVRRVPSTKLHNFRQPLALRVKVNCFLDFKALMYLYALLIWVHQWVEAVAA
jgi:hypothetical protein